MDSLVPWVALGAAATFIALLAGRLIADWSRLESVKRPHWAVLLQVAIVLALGMAYWDYVVDDTFISLRYARNLAEGHGLRYDTAAGLAPVEGYTNFLWVLIQASLFALHVPEEAVVPVIKGMGLVLACSSLVLVQWGSRQAGETGAGATLPGWYLASIPFLAFWAIGGLETPLYMFLLVLGLGSWMRADRLNKPPYLASVAFLLLAITRTEGVVISGTVLVTASVHGLLSKVDRKAELRRLLPLLAVGLAYAIYFGARFAYYDFLFPNTVYAKTGGMSLDTLSARLDGLLPLVFLTAPLVVIAGAGLVAKGKLALLDWLLLAAGLSSAGLALTIEREWMPAFRYEVPTLVCLAWLTGLNATKVVERLRSTIPAWVLVSTIVLAGGIPMLAAYQLVQEREYGEALDRSHVALGAWMADSVPEADSWGGIDMGAVPFFSKVPQVVEMNAEGLLSNEITHEGYNASRIISMRPDLIFLPKDQGGPRTGYVAIYDEPVFREEYRFLVTFSFLEDNYDLFAHESLVLEPQAMEDLAILARKSQS